MALLVFLPLCLAALAAVRAARVRPVGLALPVAFAAAVVVEAIVVEALSLARAVRAAPLLAAHLALLAALLAVPRVRSELARLPRRLLRAVTATGLAGLLLGPVGALVVVSGARYEPSNWDSMTYHLARVAHWIQHASVAPYPTAIERQWMYLPGAEYLQLALQATTGTDRLAFLPQAVAFGIVVLAAPPLARLAGAPRWLAPWAALLAGTVPMAVLQASSTQNDLVSAATAVAIGVAAVPLLRRRPGRALPRDVLFLAVAGAAAALVKLPGVLAPALLAAAATGRVAVTALTGPGRSRLLTAIAAGLLLCAGVAGPSLVRARSGDPALVTPYVYPALGEWSDRAANVIRGAAHHLPAPRALVEAVGAPRELCGRGAWCARLLSRPHEDFAGNVATALALLVLLAVGALRWGGLPARARAALLTLVAGWLVFDVTFRDNAWSSRLHLPLFALSPIALGALHGLRPPGRPWTRRTLALGALLLTGQAAAFAAANVARPLFQTEAWLARREPGYYVNRPEPREGHDLALATLRDRGCGRLGLRLGPDSYDYPLTWRAMQGGAEVRHVKDGDPWPCVIFSDVGPPEAAGWEEVGPGVHARRQGVSW